MNDTQGALHKEKKSIKQEILSPLTHYIESSSSNHRGNAEVLSLEMLVNGSKVSSCPPFMSF